MRCCSNLKVGHEITINDILVSEMDDLEKIAKSKIHRNLDIIDEREQEIIRGRFGLNQGSEERSGKWRRAVS